MVVSGDDLPVIGGVIGEYARVICFCGEGGKGAGGWVCVSEVDIVLGGVPSVGVSTGPVEGCGDGGVLCSMGWEGVGGRVGGVVGGWGECGE